MALKIEAGMDWRGLAWRVLTGHHFISGFLLACLISSLSDRDYGWAIASAVLSAANFAFAVAAERNQT